MAIFPVIEAELIVQTGDKTRIDASKSFVTQDESAITDVEIEPEAGSGFISVFNTDSKKWYLDWIYSGADRTVSVSVRITASTTATNVKPLEVVTALTDSLFSSDGDLIAKENEILKRVRPGRSSFLDVHRQAQSQILQWLDEAGYRLEDGTKITKDELLDKSEVSAWSRDLTLHLLMQSFSNQVGDIFNTKANYYRSEYENRRDRSVLKYDWDKDGEITDGEFVRPNTRDLIQE